MSGPARAPEAPLETYANNVSPYGPLSGVNVASDLRERAQQRRFERFTKRAAVRRVSSLERVRKCGVVTHTPGGSVAVRVREGVAGLAGVVTCGSVWACPVCAAKILARRAVEVGGLLAAAQARGHVLGFVTLTMRHERGQSLADLWAAAVKGWRRAITGKAWQAAKCRAGCVGWVRVWEVTYGRHGWHVHVHAVMVLRAGAEASELEDLAGGMFRRWSAGLVAAGLAAPTLAGQDWHVVGGEGAGDEIAAYLSKLAGGGADALGLELTHTSSGRARRGLRTAPVWSLLAELAETGEARCLGLWGEWERGSKGKRQIGYSKGLRELFGVGEVLTDEEVAAEELGSARDDLVVILAEGWAVLAGDVWRVCSLLDAAERGGSAGVRNLLDGWGDVPYLVS